MNVQVVVGAGREAPTSATPPRSRAEFDARARVFEGGLHEWDARRGAVVVMNDVTAQHSRVLQNVLRHLLARLDPDTHDVGTQAFGVDVAGSVRFPHVIVEERVDRERGARRAISPLVLVEILSPSSTYLDLVEKPAEYATLASLDTYVVLSQDERRAWVWQRGEDGAWPSGAREIVDDAVPLPRLGLVLPMADVYRGVA